MTDDKVPFSLKLSKEEYEKLVKDAAEANMTIQEYLEDLVKRKLMPN